MNNHSVPDWSIEDVTRSLLLPAENQKSTLADNEFVELFWRDGHVVMHSQNHRKPLATFNEFKQAQKPESSMKCGGSLGNPGDLMQEDETASWFQYPLDESLEKEFCSEFFYEMPTTDATGARINKGVPASGVKLGPTGESSVLTGSASNRCSNQQAPRLGNQIQGLVDEGYTFSNDATGASTRTLKNGVRARLPREGLQANAYETIVTSSSGGSGCSFGETKQQNASNRSCKRKGRDGEESECLSEEAEYESKEANKSTHQSVSARRSRAAEVHNLSERKRRDRINEKMRALQELIPHCNKSDKASMLDEAIQYLKSLQLQVQLMWMGSGGMPPMMFPGVQQYMSCMGMGMAHAPVSSPHCQIQLPGVPPVSQSMPSALTENHIPVCPPPASSPVSFPFQLKNVHLPDPYVRYVGFHHIQPSPQAMNLYTYGSQEAEQNQPSQATAIGNSRPTSGIAPEMLQNGHSWKLNIQE